MASASRFSVAQYYELLFQLQAVSLTSGSPGLVNLATVVGVTSVRFRFEFGPFIFPDLKCVLSELH
jgi:hypothetical protein